jgi:hypothetical protein
METGEEPEGLDDDKPRTAAQAISDAKAELAAEKQAAAEPGITPVEETEKETETTVSQE